MFVRLEGVFRLVGEIFPGKPAWNVNDMPDLTGKIIIVTGSNAGIGFETAKALLEKNATVYIAVRSMEKGNQAIDELKKATGNEKVHILQIDLADLVSIQRAAAEFQRKENKLHVLINNAGVLAPPIETLTAQGYDMQFGTNVLGPYFFTKMLLPLMETTAASLPTSEPARIVEVSSESHNINPWSGSGVINYEVVRDNTARSQASSSDLYCHSKSGVLLVAKARARLLTGKNILSISVNPGHIRSGLLRYRNNVEKYITNLLMYPTPWGAINSCYAATSTDIISLSGAYLSAWARQAKPRSDHVNNVEAEDRLIAWLEEQLRMHNVL